MDQDQYKKFKNIVATALELPSDKVAVFLDEQCREDLELRNEVESLLNQDIQQDFLEKSSLEVATPQNDALQLNDQIGRIKLKKLIASGGIGEVYIGVDQVLKRSVAVKVIKAGFNLSSIGRADFLNEAQILSHLQHQNICQVFDFFEEDGKDILVLELVEGKTLRQVFKDKQQINSLEIAKQIADALVVAHERGIIHRDLKPENIMLNEQGIVKILDFGLAQLAGNQNNNKTNNQISGTPGYMSPEQSLGQQSTTATDLWSFGILLCELLSGSQPHPIDSSANELLERSKKAKYEIPKGIGAAQSKLIKKLLSPQAENRPTARSTLNEITRIQNIPKRRVIWALSFGLLFLSLFSIWKYTIDLKEQTDKANLARIEAEKLASFMLHDLHPRLRALGKLELLESAAKETLNYYENLDSEQSKKTLDKQALALIKISSVFDEQGQIQKALETLIKAKLILQKLHLESPIDEKILLKLGQAHMNIGELMTVIGEYDDSLLESQQAVDIGKKLIVNYPVEKVSDSKPSTHDRWWLRLRSLYLIADTYRRKGDLDGAINIISKALMLAESAVVKLPTLMSNYADINYMYCTTLYQIKVDEKVLKVCSKTVELSQKTLDVNPDDFRLNFHHAIDIGVLANLYNGLNQPQKALELVDRAIKITQKLTQWDPDNNNVENDLISNLNLKAQILYEKGDLAASQLLFRQVYGKIIKLSKDNEELHFIHNKLYSEIYLDKLDDAQVTAEYLKSKGMKSRDLLGLFDELNTRIDRQSQ